MHTPAAPSSARRPAPDLLKTLREYDQDFILLDASFAECDCVDDSRADYSDKRRRHELNVQSSPTRKARCCGSHPSCRGPTHDLTAARTPRTLTQAGAPTERTMAQLKCCQIVRRSGISLNADDGTGMPACALAPQGFEGDGIVERELPMRRGQSDAGRPGTAGTAMSTRFTPTGSSLLKSWRFEGALPGWTSWRRRNTTQLRESACGGIWLPMTS